MKWRLYWSRGGIDRRAAEYPDSMTMTQCLRIRRQCKRDALGWELLMEPDDIWMQHTARYAQRAANQTEVVS